MPVQSLSKQTQNNWWIDTALFGSAIVAALSGIYFLFLPTGGYQAGRNPYYKLEILFTRHTWDDLHIWGGVALIVAALIHLAIHWTWVTSVSRRAWRELTGKCSPMNARARGNLLLNGVVAASFMLTALSGVYFLFAPGGRGAVDPLFLFSRSSWDMIHTWAGVTLIAAAIVHFAIHWKWVAKVTRKMVGMRLLSRSANPSRPVANG
jgi:hypothetical protein